MERKGRLVAICDRFVRVVHKASMTSSIAALFLLGLLLAANVVIRFVLKVSFAWSDELVSFATTWVVFVGAVAIETSDGHIALDFLKEVSMPKLPRLALRIFVAVGTVLAALVLLTGGWVLTMDAREQLAPVTRLSRSFWYVLIPISGLFMMLGRVCREVRDWHKEK